MTGRAPASYTSRVSRPLRALSRPALTSLAIVVAASLAAVPGLAAESGFAFLRLPVSTRSAGMGETGVSFLDGAAAFHLNPAGLADPTGEARSGARWGAAAEAALAHHEAFGNLRQDAVVFVLSRRAESVGLSFNTLYSEEIDQRDEVGTLLGSFGAVAYDVRLAYAYRFAPGWRLGLSGGYVRDRVAESSAHVWGFGLGTAWEVPSLPGLALGAAVRNLGGSGQFDVDGTKGEDVALPLTAQAGASYGRSAGADLHWLVAADVRKARDDDATGHAGAEVRWSVVALRAGARLGTDVGHFTAGLGLETGSFRFEYAFLPSGEDLGTSHRAELSARFGM